MISLTNIEDMEELKDFIVKMDHLVKNYSFSDQLEGVVLEEGTRDSYDLDDCSQDCLPGYRKVRVVGPHGEWCYCERILTE